MLRRWRHRSGSSSSISISWARLFIRPHAWNRTHRALRICMYSTRVAHCLTSHLVFSPEARFRRAAVDTDSFAGRLPHVASCCGRFVTRLESWSSQYVSCMICQRANCTFGGRRSRQCLLFLMLQRRRIPLLSFLIRNVLSGGGGSVYRQRRSSSHYGHSGHLIHRYMHLTIDTAVLIRLKLASRSFSLTTALGLGHVAPQSRHLAAHR